MLQLNSHDIGQCAAAILQLHLEIVPCRQPLRRIHKRQLMPPRPGLLLPGHGQPRERQLRRCWIE